MKNDVYLPNSKFRKIVQKPLKRGYGNEEGARKEKICRVFQTPHAMYNRSFDWRMCATLNKLTDFTNHCANVCVLFLI